MDKTTLTYDKARVISFSDAIFSIAMTLLVLELSIPTYSNVEDYDTWHALGNLIPSFIGFLVSFLVTALYWVAHLRIMRHVTTIDTKMLWLNIFLLLFIVLLPFSTAFYVNGFILTGPFVFYCLNLSAIGLFNFLIIRYVLLKERKTAEISVIEGKIEKARALNALFVWLLAALFAFFLPMVARGIFVLIFVFNRIIKWYFNKNTSKE